MRVESGLTGWHLAGTSLLDRSKEGEEEAEEEAAEAAPLIDVDCRRRCWELFFADVVTALALAELDAAAEGGIRDGTAALRAERRSIVKLVGRGEVLSEKEDRRKRESQWQRRVRLFFFFFFFFFVPTKLKTRPAFWPASERRKRGEAHLASFSFSYPFRDLR